MINGISHQHVLSYNSLFMKAMLQRPGLLETLANAVIKTVYEAIYVLIDLPHLSRLLLLKPYRLHASLSSQSLRY